MRVSRDIETRIECIPALTQTFIRILILTVSSVSMVVGCATNFDAADFQGLRQVSPNIYEVFYEDHKGIFGSQGSLQNKVVSEANTLADRQGMVASPIEARQHREGILGDWAWSYYRFELSPKEDSKISKTASEINFEGDARMSNNFLATNKRSTQSTQTKYDDLIQLDGLHRKGILSDEEFQREKDRILLPDRLE